MTKTTIPDAWDDDDWETQADKMTSDPASAVAVLPVDKITKSERLAQHAESNKKLWESAYVGIEKSRRVD